MNKLLISIFLASISYTCYAASQPAVNISRANCYAPLPQWLGLPGVGYHNESLSYDRLFASHRLRVSSQQTRYPNITRNLFYPSATSFNYTSTWRAYAGQPDSSNLGWAVTGNHQEILDSGQYIQSNTFATGCNITEW